MPPDPIKPFVFFGASDRHYFFLLYPIDTRLPNVAAVYSYIHVNAELGIYEPLYVGEVERLDMRFADKHTWRCVNKCFVNAIAIYIEENSEKRQEIVQDIIANCHLVCNDL